jgi:hypothetical protein
MPRSSGDTGAKIWPIVGDVSDNRALELQKIPESWELIEDSGRASGQKLVTWIGFYPKRLLKCEPWVFLCRNADVFLQRVADRPQVPYF